MLKILRRVLSIVLLLISVSLIVWAFLPNQHQVITQSISSPEMQLPSNGQVSIASRLETRRVVLEWPNSMRIGEKEEITLLYEPVENETASPKQQVESADIYNSYSIMVEARFEVAGIKISPANPTRESMPAGQPVTFKWQISTEQVRSYDGTVWLSLRFLSLDGSQASQVPVYIREVSIRTVSLFGLSEKMAYIVGGVGIVFGGVIIFDDIIGRVRKWLRKITMKVR